NLVFVFFLLFLRFSYEVARDETHRLLKMASAAIANPHHNTLAATAIVSHQPSPTTIQFDAATSEGNPNEGELLYDNADESLTKEQGLDWAGRVLPGMYTMSFLKLASKMGNIAISLWSEGLTFWSVYANRKAVICHEMNNLGALLAQYLPSQLDNNIYSYLMIIFPMPLVSIKFYFGLAVIVEMNIHIKFILCMFKYWKIQNNYKYDMYILFYVFGVHLLIHDLKCYFSSKVYLMSILFTHLSNVCWLVLIYGRMNGRGVVPFSHLTILVNKMVTMCFLLKFLIFMSKNCYICMYIYIEIVRIRCQGTLVVLYLFQILKKITVKHDGKRGSLWGGVLVKNGMCLFGLHQI
ncbi:hypothetical protein ACJX0J_020082, partial [Zea mays]